MHYHGFHSKFDAKIKLSENRIRPFGKYSKRFAKKYPRNKLWRVPASQVYEERKDGSEDKSNNATDVDNNQIVIRTRQIQEASSQYSHYLSKLASERLQIVQVLGDGNCLFRSVAHQVYGDNDLHWLVRQKCMDYMEADADFFSQFVEGGRESFELYLRAKRMNACWGDDPEIQVDFQIDYILQVLLAFFNLR